MSLLWISGPVKFFPAKIMAPRTDSQEKRSHVRKLLKGMPKPSNESLTLSKSRTPVAHRYKEFSQHDEQTNTLEVKIINQQISSTRFDRRFFANDELSLHDDSHQLRSSGTELQVNPQYPNSKGRDALPPIHHPPVFAQWNSPARSPVRITYGRRLVKAIVREDKHEFGESTPQTIAKAAEGPQPTVFQDPQSQLEPTIKSTNANQSLPYSLGDDESQRMNRLSENQALEETTVLACKNGQQEANGDSERAPTISDFSDSDGDQMLSVEQDFAAQRSGSGSQG